MIIINKSQPNTIVLTLTEKVTLEAPYFLFVFTNDHSKQVAICVAADESEFTRRYNKFTITETASPNALSGEVTLSPEGFWTYEVYEQSSGTNLDPADATVAALLERGKLRVIAEAAADHTYTPDTDINYIYEG